MTDDRFKVSWSSLQRFELCKQKDYLVRQHKSSPLKDARNFLAGTTVDNIQKAWLDNPVGQMVDMVDFYFDKSIAETEKSNTIKWRDKNDKKKIHAVVQGATILLQPILEARVLPHDYEPGVRFYTPVRIKKPDTGEIVEIILRGEFDLLVKDRKDGRFIVWDLKTTADNNYWQKTLGQLVFYDLAIISMYNEPPKKTGLIQPLCDEQVKEFFFSGEDRSNMWGRIVAMLQAEWTDDHSPKADNTGCNFCEVAHACAKFNKSKWVK